MTKCAKIFGSGVTRTASKWDKAHATKQLTKEESMFGKREPDAMVSLAFRKACIAREGLEYNWVNIDEFGVSFESFLTTLQSYLRAKQKNKYKTSAAEDQVTPWTTNASAKFKIPQDSENQLAQSKTPPVLFYKTIILVHIKFRGPSR